ncbi:MAG: potassium transporter TrkG, partial [Acidimicrobiales bacterium]
MTPGAGTSGEHHPLVKTDHSFADQARAGRWESPSGFVVGVAALACGVLALASCLIGLVTDGRDTEPFGVLALVWGLVGASMVHVFRVPVRLRSSTAFIGVLAVWLTLVLLSTATYEILGTFRFWDDSIFESVSGFTTTASSVVRDPEALSRATLLWRAGTQWLGGLGALLFVVAVLPSIGVGGLDVTEAGQRHAGTSLRSRRTVAQMRRLASLYALLTSLGILLFLAGGMGPFDSVTYAATTISTGGFANHAGSFGHFDSTTIEWAGFGGMVLGGCNMALLFRALRGTTVTPLWRSFELRAYVTVIVVVGAIVALTTVPSGGLTHESVRMALFHVASAASTTG